jgi:hypothetical protein
MLTARKPEGVHMLTYKFKLSDDSGGVEDDFGVHLSNAEIACRYACDVTRELMHHRERRTRHWRLDVYEDNGEEVFEIAFAKLDQALNHLRPDTRELCALNTFAHSKMSVTTQPLHGGNHGHWQRARAGSLTSLRITVGR